MKSQRDKSCVSKHTWIFLLKPSWLNPHLHDPVSNSLHFEGFCFLFTLFASSTSLASFEGTNRPLHYPNFLDLVEISAIFTLPLLQLFIFFLLLFLSDLRIGTGFFMVVSLAIIGFAFLCLSLNRFNLIEEVEDFSGVSDIGRRRTSGNDKRSVLLKRGVMGPFL